MCNYFAQLYLCMDKVKINEQNIRIADRTPLRTHQIWSDLNTSTGEYLKMWQGIGP